MTTITKARLYDRAQTMALLDSMAAQVSARLTRRDRLAVIGILRRGAPLAELLCSRMAESHGIQPHLRMNLLVKRYADNLDLLYPQTLLSEQPEHAHADLAKCKVLVVDDVLYTGHSLLKVTSYLSQQQPLAIWSAVLVDRGCRRIPVVGDVVGARLDVAPSDVIECHVPPYEPSLQINVVTPERTETKADSDVSRP